MLSDNIVLCLRRQHKIKRCITMVSKELFTVEFPSSVLTKKQSKNYSVEHFEGFGIGTIKIRYDDSCNNNHNTFSITVDGRNFGGCMHSEIIKVRPELKKFIKWHLCSADGPLYYIANTIYHIRENNIKYARSSAIWEDMPENIGDLSDHQIKILLIERLPNLMKEFKADVESLGFTY